MKDKLIQEAETQIKYLYELYSDINNGNLVPTSEILDEILNSKFLLENIVDYIKENK